MQPEQLRALAASKEQLIALIDRGDLNDAMTSKTESGYDLLMLLLYYPENFRWFLNQRKVAEFLKNNSEALLTYTQSSNALLLALNDDVVALHPSQSPPFKLLVSILNSRALLESAPSINNKNQRDYLIQQIMNRPDFKDLIKNATLLEAALPKSSLLLLTISQWLPAENFLIHIENLKKNKTLDVCITQLSKTELETLAQNLSSTAVRSGDELLEKISVEALSFNFIKLLPFFQLYFKDNPQEWKKFLKTLDRNFLITLLKKMGLNVYHYDWQVRPMYLLIILYKEFGLLDYAANLIYKEIHWTEDGHGRRSSYVYAGKSLLDLVAITCPKSLLMCLKGMNKATVKANVTEAECAFYNYGWNGSDPASYMEILGRCETFARLGHEKIKDAQRQVQMEWHVIIYMARIHHYLMSIDYKNSDLAKAWHKVCSGIKDNSIKIDKINGELKGIRNMGGFTSLSGPMHDNINALRRLSEGKNDADYNACLIWGFGQYAAFLENIKNDGKLGYGADADFANFLLKPVMQVDNSKNYSWFHTSKTNAVSTVASKSSSDIELQDVQSTQSSTSSLAPTHS